MGPAVTGRRRASDLAARAAAVANATALPAAADDAASDPQIRTSAPSPRPARADAAAAVRARPVRVTVELQPIEHRRLRRLCERYADDLGVVQVAGAEVLRVMLGMLDDDELLAARVGEQLRRTGGNRRR